MDTRSNIRKTNSRIVIAVVLTVCCLLSAVIAPPAYATLSDAELQQNLDSVNSQRGAKQSEYDKAKAELNNLAGQIASLEAQIASTEGEIESTEALIIEYDAQLAKLAIEIARLEGEVGDQDSALNQRLRVMYETDSGSLFAVLLGSESIVDFLSNLDMVKRIHESDRQLLDELQGKLDALEDKKAEVQRIEEALTAQKTSLEEYKASLDVKKSEVDAAKARAQEIRDAAYEDLVELEKESKRIEQELASRHSDLTYGGGPLAWPCYGRITSEYGMRVNPVHGAYILHAGIDVGVSTGTPIRAAADGVVIFAGWSGGYGNFVMIDHGVMEDGRAVVTCYAHNSGFAVSNGRSVLKGDVIAYAGSTGNSTGPHCHFEVRVNGSPQNPRGWL